MSTSHLFIKYLRLLGVIQLSVFLVSCDGEPITLATVAVTASVNEGFNPLTVTFDVRGPDIIISGATWDFGDDEEAQTIGASSITHTFVNPGKVTVLVTVIARDSSSGDFKFDIPINVLPDVNLIVSSFAIDTEVTPGGLETISAIIQNIGTDTFTGSGAATTHIEVGYYLSTDDNITVDDIFIGDTSIFTGSFFSAGDISFGFQALAPGANYQYNHQLAVKGNVPAGTYYAGAIVDYIDEFHWYSFPRATATLEFLFPGYLVVPETNEEDNVRLLTAHQVTVTAAACVDDPFEDDDSSATASLISIGDTQVHNFCFDNSDWLQFDATQGGVYKITTFALGVEADTQLILYDTDGSTILLFHDNMGNTEDETHTVDLESGFPSNPASEIVWETQVTDTYFIKVRTTACDEDKDSHCSVSPVGVGLDTGYSITLQ